MKIIAVVVSICTLLVELLHLEVVVAFGGHWNVVHSFKGLTRHEAAGSSGQIEQYGFQNDDVWLKRNDYMIAIVDDEESIRLAIGDYLFDRYGV